MSEGKRALITGITGQDGGYLAEFLLERGYEVYGLIRRSSSMANRKWIDPLDIKLIYGDMLDSVSIENAVIKSQPHEVYNLASQSHVGISFQIPEYTAKVNAIGVIKLLEAIRKFCPGAKVYQASTSEMYGSYDREATEESPFSANSPYAASKLFAHNICEMYREAYKMFICCGILFNHESPRRGLNFVTRKITNGLVRMITGKGDETLLLGNLNASRDWGYAGDYVEAMWLMLQQDEPDDYVIATGKTHTVREFIEEACKVLKVKLTWNGKSGLDEVGIVEDPCGNVPYLGFIQISEKYYRPVDVHFLKGNSQKAEKKLGWKPKTSFKDLVNMMVWSDYDEFV